MTKNFCETILLTGAGYTRNFGGFLADEMWAQIFNDPDVQNSPYIKNMMIDNFDYESIYQKIIRNSPTLWKKVKRWVARTLTSQNENPELEKSIIRNAILTAYQKLDDIVREWGPNIYSPDTVNHTKHNEFIKRFAGDPWEIGLFFTLNQDLFVERWFKEDAKIHLPWIESTPERAQSAAGALLDIDVIRLPTEVQLQNEGIEILSPEHLNYIKLHGSSNWTSSDGSLQLVIGGEKESQIGQEPILKSYFKIFEDALSRSDRRLMVIGYGFRDQHINKVIKDCVLAHNLKFYIISPSNPKKIVENINKADRSGVMIKGLSGVFNNNLAQIFPETKTNELTVAYQTIKKVYFEDE
jgi:SIR2-like domain